MNKFTLLFIVNCCTLFISCGNQSSSGSLFALFSKTELKKNYPDFDIEQLNEAIKISFNQPSATSEFYQKNEYVPVWTDDIYETPALDTLLNYLQNSYKHGINPERFSYSKIKELVDTLRTGAYHQNMTVFYKKLVELEQLATKAYFDYNQGLRFGFTNPKKLFPTAYYLSNKQPDSLYHETAFNSLKNDPITYLTNSQPSDSNYIKLQKELLLYHNLKDTPISKIPKKSNKNYTVNAKDKTVFPLIAKRLILTNDLPPTDKVDSVYSSLTPELLKAINLFRIKIGYPEDKEVGAYTIDALNRPMSYYLQLLQANLERYRWQSEKDRGDKFIEVNVAAFMLKAIEKGKEPLLSRVCVGKAGTNQTPLLESEIKFVNLNPKWNVPASITEKEIYWSVKKNPNYLSRNNMKLIDKSTGKEVDANSLNWDELNPKKLSFRVQQASGSGNSLGRIKFMFDNRFAVYLHDTPSKSAFSRKNRAISHGCVRVQKPIDLAFFCIENREPIYQDRILVTIDQTPRSEEGKAMQKSGKLQKVGDIVNMENRIPLFIRYYTADPSFGEKVHFADDVYKFDDKIIKALNEF